jgi:cobalt-zinc-cadmium efflux system membrane fusion protein
MEARTMNFRFPKLSPTFLKWSALIGVIGGAVLAAAIFHDHWLPQASALLSTAAKSSDDTESSEPHDDHAGHDDGHGGHEEANSLELSPQARKNIGLTTAAVKLQPFVRSVSVPAIVIGRPGRSHTEVTSPLGGRVTRIYRVEGDAVEPGQPLFDLRLTHEELVQAQGELLRSAAELDVEEREIRRLETFTESGVIAGKRLLERRYEKEKIEAVLNSRRQSLLLHGLTQQQVDDIVVKRVLVQNVTIFAPEYPRNGNDVALRHPFTLKTLHIDLGQYVDAGAPLCSLMDYGELYIRGLAFERDADELMQAEREGWELGAIREDSNKQAEAITGLKIVYVANEIEPESRALHFYVSLPNRIISEKTSDDGHRFLTWQYKPGQRMQLRVPVEKWADRIVLPIDAVAKEGVEFYVFQQNGDHFDRVPVQVEYQDQFWMVIANDGSVFPGDTVAMSGAHQLQMALKNKAGGGVDPHAGHNH